MVGGEAPGYLRRCATALELPPAAGRVTSPVGAVKVYPDGFVRKLLLLSILVVSFALPISAARDRSAVRGMRRTIVGMAVCVVLYVIALLFILPRLS